MSTQEKKTGALTDRMRRVRESMRDTACGPLIAAGEIVAIANAWPSYKKEAGGRSLPAFLTKELGKGYTLSYFQRRHRAVQRIGEHARVTWHHAAAAWASECVKDELTLKRLDKAVGEAYRLNSRNPISVQSVHRLARKIIGRLGKVRTAVPCERCERLNAWFRQQGIDIPK